MVLAAVALAGVAQLFHSQKVVGSIPSPGVYNPLSGHLQEAT